MDLYKVEDHYVLTADLPGVDPGSVDVLSVTIPQTEKAKPRRIEVSAAGARRSIEPTTVDSTVESP